MPSIQIRNGLRQRAGEISERAAISENARHMVQKLGYANAGTELKACRQTQSVHRPAGAKVGTGRALLRDVFLFVKKYSCSKLKNLVSQLRSCLLKKMFAGVRIALVAEKTI
jgi:hypothetical protein